MKSRDDDGPLPCGSSCYAYRTIWEDGETLTREGHGADCKKKKA